VSVTGVAVGQPAQVTLTAASVGTSTNPKFKIVSGPAHGTLSQVAGQPFDSAQLTYTPSNGFTGSDTFTYVAFDANSEFPRTPTVATVVLTGVAPVPTVAISGAPASMLTGTSIQLTASVTADPPSVQWRVNGVLGGTTATGTITSAGLYTAPATPPAGGSVTIRATSASAQSEVSIRIDPQPAPLPAPAPAPEPAPAPATSPAPAAVPVPAPVTSQLSTTAPLLPPIVRSVKPLPLLAAPALARRGNVLVIGSSSGKAGTVEISAWKGSSRIGRCLTRTPASRSLTCQIRLRAGSKISGIQVTVRLLVGGKVIALRRATFSRQIASHRNLAIYRGTGLQCWLSEPGR